MAKRGRKPAQTTAPAEPRVSPDTLIGAPAADAPTAGPGPVDELADKGPLPAEPLPTHDPTDDYNFDDIDELDKVLPHEEKAEGDAATAATEPAPAPEKPVEPAPQVEASPEEAEEPVPEQPSIDSRLLAQAEVLGFSQEELASFPTEESLASALELVGRKILGPAAQPSGQPQPQQPTPQAQRQPQQPEAPPEGLDERLEINLSEEEFGPEVVAAFKQVDDHYHGQIQDLRQVLMGLCNYLDGRDAMAVEEQFDEWIGGLEGYDGIFAKGSIMELEPQSEPVKNRHKVFAAMGKIGEIYRRRNERVPPPKRLRDLALRFEFGDHQATAIRREMSQKLQQQERSAIGRPVTAAPAGVPPTGEAAARRFERDYLKDHGHDLGGVDPDAETDGI